jgi:hypothetical protein
MYIVCLGLGLRKTKTSKLTALLVSDKNSLQIMQNKRLKKPQSTAIDCGCEVAQPFSVKYFFR